MLAQSKITAPCSESSLRFSSRRSHWHRLSRRRICLADDLRRPLRHMSRRRRQRRRARSRHHQGRSGPERFATDDADWRRIAGPRDAGCRHQRRGTAGVDRVRQDTQAPRRIPALPQEFRDEQRQSARRHGAQRRIGRRAGPLGRQPDPPAAKRGPWQVPRGHVRDYTGPPTTEILAAIGTPRCDRSTNRT